MYQVLTTAPLSLEGQKEISQALADINQFKKEDGSLEVLVGDNVIKIPSVALTLFQRAAKPLAKGDGVTVEGFGEFMAPVEASKFLQISLPLVRTLSKQRLLPLDKNGMIDSSRAARFKEDMAIINYLSETDTFRAPVSATREEVKESYPCPEDIDDILDESLRVGDIVKRYPVFQFEVDGTLKRREDFASYLPQLRGAFDWNSERIVRWLYTPCELELDSFCVSIDEALSTDVDELQERLGEMTGIESYNLRHPVDYFVAKDVPEEIFHLQLKTLGISNI
ncbi:hypothetical protein [Vibrio crassostreae]|uniref:hypothetical protein n=1 Tax=Vibrio crassostreae TaxID=246167 RepID=UPI001B30FCDC|nr:hypothetical protein [Vibrio crassostreae]